VTAAPDLSGVREALVVRPGDTLIVRYAHGTTLDTIAKVRDIIKERLPGLADVLVIGADEIAVYRPEATPSEIATWRKVAETCYVAVEQLLDSKHLDTGLQVSDRAMADAEAACRAYGQAIEATP
jgi:hypothetical protein